DRALALKMEDRPQSIDEFAALIEMPVAGLDDVMSVKKPGTMLVPVEEEETTPAAETGWRRYKMPGLIAAGVLVGLVAGGLLFGGSGDNPAPETASND
ncbi:serine/threonine protein kinase, partial [Cronobacter sakazakii]